MRNQFVEALIAMEAGAKPAVAAMLPLVTDKTLAVRLRTQLITTLARIMNRARQEQITTEIMEIVGGAEALRGGKGLVADDFLADTIENRKEDLFRER